MAGNAKVDPCIPVGIIAGGEQLSSSNIYCSAHNCRIEQCLKVLRQEIEMPGSYRSEDLPRAPDFKEMAENVLSKPNLSHTELFLVLAYNSCRIADALERGKL